jgi:release factor glutamine methyltransferase
MRRTTDTGAARPSNGPAETVTSAARRLVRAFSAAGIDTPQLDARILVAAAAGLPRSALIATPEQPLTPNQVRRLNGFEARRCAREPVARIIGRREFHGLELEIGRATLDPRPDTETVVAAVLELAAGTQTPWRVLDLGTGSGAILIAILASLPHATGLGTDIDGDALDIARRNAARHSVAERARFQRSDWLTGVEGTFDVIVSNPPYIPSADIASLQPEVAHHDPRLALDGGGDGLAAYRAIAADARRALAPDGWLVLEVGLRQAQPVLEICAEKGLEPDARVPHIRRDLADHPRCVAVKTRR